MAHTDPFSPIPTWVKKEYSLKSADKWVSFNQQRLFEEGGASKESLMFQIPKSRGRVDLSVFRLSDAGLFESPFTEDRDKEFATALPSDFNTLNRAKLLYRPSMILIDEIRIADGEKIEKVKLTAKNVTSKRIGFIFSSTFR